ncbi:MAG: acid phosphatase type 7 [Hyphomicrobiales bacterium]|nr:acid phosphatase type 7 [Bradyrhizobium sp.]MEA2880581.1 acid phosphatase type 7 [Hyphomicrobiales bacterium]
MMLSEQMKSAKWGGTQFPHGGLAPARPDRPGTLATGGRSFAGARTIGLALLCFLVAGAAARAQEPGPQIGTLLAAGDIAKCNPGSGKDEATAAILDAEIAKAKAAGVPVRILALGDLAYDDGTKPQFFQCYNSSWGANGKKALTLPVIGNHDRRTEEGRYFFEYFEKELKALYADGDPRNGYYSLRFPDPANGAWQLIGLNAYDEIGKGSTQLKWLEKKLKSSNARCVVAFAHPFRFSSGFHGHKDDPREDATVEPGSKLEHAYPVLHAQKASLLLTGHDHSFEQFAKQSVDGVASPDGIRSFVVGTGGAGLYASHRDKKGKFGPKNKLYHLAYKQLAPNSEKYSQTSRGVLKVELYATGYRWGFLPIDGDAGIPLGGQFEPCNVR